MENLLSSLIIRLVILPLRSSLLSLSSMLLLHSLQGMNSLTSERLTTAHRSLIALSDLQCWIGCILDVLSRRYPLPLSILSTILIPE